MRRKPITPIVLYLLEAMVEGRRVLVAGASGFLGRAVVRSFARAGWDVRGLVRRPDQRPAVRALGAEAVLGDVLDPASLYEAAAGCGTIVHLAANPAEALEDEAAHRAVRVTGGRHLSEAARRSGARRLVVGSGYWVYADQPGPISEDSPVAPVGEAAINYETERVGLAAEGCETVVVRPGMVYGDGAWFRPMFEAIRAGQYAVIGAGANPWSFVAVEDAGEGFVVAAERGEAGRVYNLVDGTPAPWGEFARFVAGELGRPPPGRVEPEDAAHRFGPLIARQLSARRAAQADRLRALGWRPRFPRYPEGVRAVLRALPHEAGRASPDAGPRSDPAPVRPTSRPGTDRGEREGG